jgi:hypothetical protein
MNHHLSNTSVHDARIENAETPVDELSENVVQSHFDILPTQALQQLLADEPGREIVKTSTVRDSTGVEQEKWKTAAEAELSNNFMKMGAFHVSTPEELARHGRALPMLNVWSKSDGLCKCRACICGNFAKLDPTLQSWTAQAEPSSLLAALKYSRIQKCLISKHDVKSAFMHATLPESTLVIVEPPKQWVDWGLVPPGVFWTLDKAVYGLRESPKLWSDERDSKLSTMEWKSTSGNGALKRTVHLSRCSSDSQLYCIREKGDRTNKLHGLLVVYVDDFLLLSPDDTNRATFLKSLSDIWKLGKEVTLSPTQPLTFLGIDVIMHTNQEVS